MGWIYPYEILTKKSLIADIMSNWDKTENKVLSTKSVRDGMWILVQIKNMNHPIIGFYLMKKAGGSWGYKDMEEACGPCYYDCPLEYLVKAPEVNEAWRVGVREHYRKKNELAKKAITLVPHKTYKVGGYWRMHGNRIDQIFVTSVKPCRGLFMDWIVRIPRKMIADMTEA